MTMTKRTYPDRSQGIYLDYAATTPLAPEVMEAMKPFFSEKFGNASSIHRFGQEARTAVEQARESVARAIGAKPSEIVFTGSGTEADNLAIIGGALGKRRNQPSKKRIIVSAIEHEAVHESANFLKTLGLSSEHNVFLVETIGVDRYGRVDESTFEACLGDDTALVSIMLVNNEVGTIQSIARLSAIAHDHGALFHTDAVQAVGKIPVNVDELGVDLLSLSAHKFYGPKGVGALYIRDGVDVEAILHGGGQERGRRSGTTPVPLIVGLGAAIELAISRMEEETAHAMKLKTRLVQSALGERELFSDVIINGHPEYSVPNVVSISFPFERYKLDGDALIMALDVEGIAVTSSAACSSGALRASHVLLAMGLNEPTAKATIGFSFGRWTTEDEIDEAVQVLEKVIGRLKG